MCGGKLLPNITAYLHTYTNLPTSLISKTLFLSFREQLFFEYFQQFFFFFFKFQDDYKVSGSFMKQYECGEDFGLEFCNIK